MATILLVLAIVLVALEAFRVDGRFVSLGWLGLFFYLLVQIAGAIGLGL